jgi:nitroreductase
MVDTPCQTYFKSPALPVMDMMKSSTKLKRWIFSRNLAGVAKAVWKREYFREIHAVHKGTRVYREQTQGQHGCNGMLRRNIHRLEKGLIMQPRRNIFAREYIEETVEQFHKHLHKTSCMDQDPSTLWFHDVLERYFQVVDSCVEIDRAKGRFLTAAPLEPTGKSPRPYKNIPASGIPFQDFLVLCRKRRSVRWYLPDPVPRELVNQALTAAALSPSACNRQPFVFHIFDAPEEVSRIASIPMGTVGFSQQFPMIAVVVGDLSHYQDGRDRHVIYIDASLASMAFMLALETLGLASCPINWPDIEAKECEMQKALSLELYQRPVMLISIGYADPDGLVPYSEKKSLNELSQYHDGNH